MARFKVERKYAGCYFATFGDQSAYIERSADDPSMWMTSAAEGYFGRYAEARATTEVVLRDNAAYA